MSVEVKRSRFLNSAAYEDMADFRILTMADFEQIRDKFSLYTGDYVIYCKTDFTPLLFEHLKMCSRNHVLITHHSDYPIDDRRVASAPKCIRKWYAINKTTMDSRVIGIPIGTKTPQGRAYHEPAYDIEGLEHNIDVLRKKGKDISSVYCNWRATNPDRASILGELKVPYVHSEGLSFREYCEEMSSYKVVISPPGNGLDNHRTWEALYMGCIPVVIDHPMYDSWPTLPIIRVKSYAYLTADIIKRGIVNSIGADMKYTTPEYWWSKIRM